MTEKIPADSHISRIALAVESLDRVLPFYRDTLGFSVERENSRAILTTGSQVLVVLEEVPDTPPRSPDAAGLFHFAVRVPDRAALADVLDRARKHETALTGASDHRVSEALYFRDPEGNGIEVSRDFPRTSWPETGDESVGIDTLALNLEGLAEDATGQPGLPAETYIGHVHLETSDLKRAEAFYHGTLGFEVRDRYGEEATFLAAGGYHHHIGLNTWNNCTAPASSTRGLQWFEVIVPDQRTANSIVERLHANDRESKTTDQGVAFSDPDSVEIRLALGS